MKANNETKSQNHYDPLKGGNNVPNVECRNYERKIQGTAHDMAVPCK